MGDLVIYENAMNKLQFGSLTKSSLNFFMALCYFLKGKGSEEITLTFKELREKSNYTATSIKSMVDDLDAVTDQLLKVNAKIININDSGKRKIDKFDIFPTFNIDEEAETLTVAVNSKFTWLLNEFEHYTSIDLDEIVNFKSKYTKNIFRLIRQWKSKGELKITGAANILEFRAKIGVKETYSNAEMNRRCLAPSVQEINESNCSIKNLSYELDYAHKRGKPLNAIIFKWDKVINEADTLPDITNDSAYLTVKDVLKDRSEFTEDDIVAIARASKEANINDTSIKQRLYYVLKRENVKNVVGYCIAMMKKFKDPKELKKVASSFNDFQKQDYDFAELEKKLFANTDAYAKAIQDEEAEKKEPIEKLTDYSVVYANEIREEVKDDSLVKLSRALHIPVEDEEGNTSTLVVPIEVENRNDVMDRRLQSLKSMLESKLNK